MYINFKCMYNLAWDWKSQSWLQNIYGINLTVPKDVIWMNVQIESRLCLFRNRNWAIRRLLRGRSVGSTQPRGAGAGGGGGGVESIASRWLTAPIHPPHSMNPLLLPRMARLPRPLFTSSSKDSIKFAPSRVNWILPTIHPHDAKCDQFAPTRLAKLDRLARRPRF